MFDCGVFCSNRALQCEIAPTRAYFTHPTHRFDMYSVGITLMQLAFPVLRNDNSLIAFNKKLRECNCDLNKWRANEAMSK